MTDRMPYTFVEDDCIRVAPVNHGWQIQFREDASSEWHDIPEQWYKQIAPAVATASKFIKV
jgi:hypothetical protein